MPRRTPDPQLKPFEMKVGVSFASFGGMYQLGDPSTCPPNRFRRLVNVRIGEKDVRSRPGLDTAWSGSDEPVLGMSEISKKAEGGKIWHGPGYFVQGYAYSQTEAIIANYAALVIDYEWPDFTVDVAPIERVLWYLCQTGIPTPLALAGGPDAEQHDTGMRQLGPVCHMPWSFARLGGIAPLNDMGYDRLLRGGMQHAGLLASHSHARQSEVALIGDFPAPGSSYAADFPDEQQWGNCLDAIIHFNDKWLAVGSIIPRLHNPSVDSSQLTEPSGTGQQIFELLFGTLPVPNFDPNFDPTVLGGRDPKNFLGGSIRELFRMPGQSYTDISADAPRSGGGMDGESVRSMCVVSRRTDNPINAAESTNDKIYLGTFGGYPLVPGAFTTPPPFVAGDIYRPWIHNLTDGKVYSYDSITTRLETTGLGPAVVVITLPDGSVLACGRTAAKLLDATDGTWKPVAYSPTFNTRPRFETGIAEVPPFTHRFYIQPPADDPAVPAHGFIWTDRILFRGEAYFVGMDTARSIGRPDLYEPYSSGFAPYLFPPYQYVPTFDAWVIYRFDKATLTMVKVRDGAALWMAVQPFLTLLAPLDPQFLTNDPYSLVNAGQVMQFVASLSCTLAVFDDRLVYAWGLVVEAPSQLEYLIDPVATGVGTFDGVNWDDRAYNLFAGGLAVDAWDSGIVDMLSSPRGIWMQTPTNLALFDGAFTPVAHFSTGQVFGNGDFGMGRLFFGPK